MQCYNYHALFSIPGIAIPTEVINFKIILSPTLISSYFWQKIIDGEKPKKIKRQKDRQK